MVNRIKNWLRRGEEVRIVTARAHDWPEQIPMIQDYIERLFGVRLLIQANKDIYMIDLWDNAAVQVITNTGVRADGRPD
jgi:hypothetical protein